MFTYIFVSYKTIEIGFYHQNGQFECLHTKTNLDEAKKLVDFLNRGVI